MQLQTITPRETGSFSAITSLKMGQSFFPVDLDLSPDQTLKCELGGVVFAPAGNRKSLMTVIL